MNWISVEERFPELIGGSAGPTTKEVLVFGGDNQWGMAMYDYEQNKWVNTHFDLPDITHWCEVTPPNRYSNMSEETAKDAIAVMKEGIEINKKFLDGKGVKHE